MFSSKTEERKTWMDILDDMGVSKLSAKVFFQNGTTPLILFLSFFICVCLLVLHCFL